MSSSTFSQLIASRRSQSFHLLRMLLISGSVLVCDASRAGILPIVEYTYGSLTPGGKVANSGTMGSVCDATIVGGTIAASFAGPGLHLVGATNMGYTWTEPPSSTALNAALAGESFKAEATIRTTFAGGDHKVNVVVCRHYQGGCIGSWTLAVLQDTGRPRFAIWAPSGIRQADATMAVNDGAYHRIAGGYDMATNRVWVAVLDPVTESVEDLVITPIPGSAESINSLASPLMVGDRGKINRSGSAFEGEIDTVRLFMDGAPPALARSADGAAEPADESTEASRLAATDHVAAVILPKSNPPSLGTCPCESEIPGTVALDCEENAVPTLTEWAIILLSLGLLGCGFLMLPRSKVPVLAP